MRLFAFWNEPAAGESEAGPKYDRVEVPMLALGDMFDDAFTAIARDGAGTVEVAVRLQKALRTLTSIGGAEMQAAARRHAQLACKRAENGLDLEEDVAAVQQAAAGSTVRGDKAP